jgi:predicted kinase
MLIAMAGLPGTGKSTLANRLARELGGVVLSKDVVRSAMFPPPVLDYSATQDDLAMQAVFSAAKHLLQRNPAQVVILDGRTFRKAIQVADLLALGREVGQEPFIIECVCDEATARNRLDRDAATGTHPAGNRNGMLHTAVRATAEPLTVPRLTIDTGLLSPDEALARVWNSLGVPGSSPETCNGSQD